MKEKDLEYKREWRRKNRAKENAAHRRWIERKRLVSLQVWIPAEMRDSIKALSSQGQAEWVREAITEKLEKS